MNATIIVAASSMVLAIFAVVFFLLQDAADGGMVNAYGEMTIPQEDGTSTVSAKYAMDGTTRTVSFAAEGSTSMMTEFFDAAGNRNIQSYEWDTNGPVLCKFNLERDFELFDALKVSLDSVTVGGGSTISVTDGQSGGTAELNVDYTMIEGAAPADWLPAPIDEDECHQLDLDFVYTPDPDDEGERKLRELGETTASRMAQDVYDDAKSTCHDTDDIIGWKQGEVCWRVEDCNLSFRGSDDNADWVDNILGTAFWVTGKDNTKIHSGFFNQYESWYNASYADDCADDCVPQSFKDCGNNKVWIGHSLGGAIASVAAHQLGGVVNTYAAPKPFVNKARRQNGMRTYHESDPVPQQPMTHSHGCGGSGCSLKKIYEKCTSNAFRFGLPYPCGCGWRGCRTCWQQIFDGPCIGWSTKTTMESSISDPLTRPKGSGTGSAIFQNIKEKILGFFTSTGSCASAGGHFHSMTACYQPYGQ